ncbi:MAG: hypothetical protein QM662_13820 [Gordonia sp. (in: high G+C Gram-positive bacteria)]
MSTTPDSSKAYVWQDGDAFRAPAGTALPADPFSLTLPLTSGTSQIEWKAYGGIQAGFNTTPDQDIKKIKIFNKRNSNYAISRGAREDTVKFKAVDFTAATVLTALCGGSITQIGTTGIYQWDQGNAEEFALLWRLADPSNSSTNRFGFYTPVATLASPPPRSFSGDDLDGFEFELLALEPMVPISNYDPLA